jgi:hypothetical protein
MESKNMGCTLKYNMKDLKKIQGKRKTKQTKARPVKKAKRPVVYGSRINTRVKGKGGVLEENPIHIIDQQVLEIDGEYVKITMLGRF